MIYNIQDKDVFLRFSESLKLIRKTNIEDYLIDKNIDDIYTDLLPNNGIINKVNLPRTTILVGRKGTGKSTIFQKSQRDIAKNKKNIPLYIDVKSLYDNSNPVITEGINPLVEEEIKKYLIYNNLLETIIIETKSKLDEFVDNSIAAKLFGFDRVEAESVKSELASIEQNISSVIKSIEGNLLVKFKNVEEIDDSKNFGVQVGLNPNPSFKVQGSKNYAGSIKKEFESNLIHYLDIKKDLISNLLKIRHSLGVDYLYIYLDDFSEIDSDAQKIFMDWFITPLNNLSEDFVKFKIAAYPNRLYYGKLDNAKIDEISLDFFDAYYTYEKKVDISKMESLALDYTKRLLKKRLEIFFPNNNWTRFFSIEENFIFDLLFSVSFNNPRKIGYILSYCYESCLIHDINITEDAIKNAALRYYTDVILKYFLANQFALKPFEDKVSNDLQYDLLLKIIERQRQNCSNAYRTRIKGKPTNHFTLSQGLNHLLNNLELNGFITTFNTIKNKSEELSIIYSLDYGLCQRNNLNFTRASDDKLINYFSQSRFNMNVLVMDHYNKTQVIRCNNGHEFPFTMYDTVKKYNMMCPTCASEGKIIICTVTNSNDEILEQLKLIEKSNYNKTSLDEFLCLDYLKTTNKPISLLKISSSLDKNESSINKLINKLIEKGLVKLDLEITQQLKKEHYNITEKGTSYINKLLDEIQKIANRNL